MHAVLIVHPFQLRQQRIRRKLAGLQSHRRFVDELAHHFQSCSRVERLVGQVGLVRVVALDIFGSHHLADMPNFAQDDLVIELSHKAVRPLQNKNFMQFESSFQQDMQFLKNMQLEKRYAI